MVIVYKQPVFYPSSADQVKRVTCDMSLVLCRAHAPHRQGTLQVVMLVWLAVLFANLGHIAEAFLTPTMERVSSALHVPPRLSGVTLLAWANGAPDLSANVAAMRAKRIDMALGSALGAGMFVTCLVGGQLAQMCNGIKVGGAMVCLYCRSRSDQLLRVLRCKLYLYDLHCSGGLNKQRNQNDTSV
jgi:hypothetical protein